MNKLYAFVGVLLLLETSFAWIMPVFTNTTTTLQDNATQTDDEGWKHLRGIDKALLEIGGFDNNDHRPPPCENCDEIRERLREKCKRKLKHQKRFYQEYGYWPDNDF